MMRFINKSKKNFSRIKLKTIKEDNENIIQIANNLNQDLESMPSKILENSMSLYIIFSF